MEKTQIQWQIEKAVTNGLGYRLAEKREGLNSESDLQSHLEFLNFMGEQTERGGLAYIGNDPATLEFFACMQP